MSYQEDTRAVLILDAGGTNFVFSAMKGDRQVTERVCLPACADNLEQCLASLETGFKTVCKQLSAPPVAISFAFPGPADYENGIISNALPNFPAFNRLEGFPLKAYLEEIFGIPVFINNDGDLYAFGEAHFGFLPMVNLLLKESGSQRQYKNLIGLTLGTGFGAGIVINGRLLLGDNGCASEVFPFRNRELSACFVEESISIRGLNRMYREETGTDKELTPKDIFEIAEGTQEGNREAAVHTFERFGRIAADAVANLVTIVDGLVVLGGGLSGAAKYFMPALLQELNGTINKADGNPISRIPQTVYDLDEEVSRSRFLQSNPVELETIGGKKIWYDRERKVGIGISQMGAVEAITKGAYSYALSRLDA